MSEAPQNPRRREAAAPSRRRCRRTSRGCCGPPTPRFGGCGRSWRKPGGAAPRAATRDPIVRAVTRLLDALPRPVAKSFLERTRPLVRGMPGAAHQSPAERLDFLKQLGGLVIDLPGSPQRDEATDLVQAECQAIEATSRERRTAGELDARHASELRALSERHEEELMTYVLSLTGELAVVNRELRTAAMMLNHQDRTAVVQRQDAERAELRKRQRVERDRTRGR